MLTRSVNPTGTAVGGECDNVKENFEFIFNQLGYKISTLFWSVLIIEGRNRGVSRDGFRKPNTTEFETGGTLMTIRPLYDRIVVKRIEQKEQMQGGLYIPDSAKEKPQEGEVVSVGKGKRLEDGKVVPLDVQVGDRILFGKYSGSDIKLDNEEFLIMREDEVLGILEAQPKVAKKAS
jgi:chaperonin GroES